MTGKSPNEWSREYYQFVESFTRTDAENEKILGKYYTEHTVAEDMCEVIGGIFKADAASLAVRIIDPFCGDGRLIVQLLSELLKNHALSGRQVAVSVWDIDAGAVRQAEKAVRSFSAESGIPCDIDARIADAFLEYKEVCSNYDICVTNPPWGLLKPQKLFGGKGGKTEMAEYCRVIERYDAYLKEEFSLSQPSPKFGRWGTNLARCGTEAALRLIKRDGICGIVSPASLLGDQVSGRLRNWIFEQFKAARISYYPAGLKLYGSADIASVSAVLCGGRAAQDLAVRIYSARNTWREERIGDAAFDYIKRQQYRIPLQTGIESIPLMMCLERFPATGDYCGRYGLRFTRELDETRVKEKLSSGGKIEFAKGYMVGRYSFESGGLFLNENLAAPASTGSSKIVWRDVSRDSQARRMQATLLPPGYICGNSLGVICGGAEELPYMKMLLAVMNSTIYEYQARSMLVSNHVSAGVVKRIRVPAPGVRPEILELVDRQLQGEDVEDLLELAVARLYGIPAEAYRLVLDALKLTEEEKERLLRGYMEGAGESGADRAIYNHYASPLSELDLRMVRCVPPGGNWKNIPESIPSQRLAQIRESYRAGKGSRSTYYARLRPDMPAYTISTYFNRPGNGCNMHYEQDRTMSQREAARFQSFPDSFEFLGPHGAVNNQIGNAVPPLLAYQIAKGIPFRGQFVDLFCGAGGLALGFIWAGWTPVVGNDIDRYAVETYRRNLGGDVIRGDANSREVQEAVIAKAAAAREAHPELPLFVLGGPPCQGFSTANTRRGASDLRNWLFQSYAGIVEAIRPEGFVFENVRGILNLEKGTFFEMIQNELRKCVCKIRVEQVCAADYGVPQRRERVIILGGGEPLVENFHMEKISSVPKSGKTSPLPSVPGAEGTVGDLPPLYPGEDGSCGGYRFPASNSYQRFMRGELTPEEYLESFYPEK